MTASTASLEGIGNIGRPFRRVYICQATFYEISRLQNAVKMLDHSSTIDHQSNTADCESVRRETSYLFLGC